MKQRTEMLKGVLEGLVLEIIHEKETYGYEITQKLNQFGFTDIVEGTVYTVLIRLEKNQLVYVAKKPSTKGPMRKFYQLNVFGEAERKNFWQNWDDLNRNIKNIRMG